VDLQIQTTQNPHTQAATKSLSNLLGFRDIKAHVPKSVDTIKTSGTLLKSVKI